MRALWTLVLLAAVATPVAAEAQLAEAVPLIRIDWSMPDRFGIDSDGDGRIDAPNSHAYAHNRIEGSCSPCPEPRFEVDFTARPVGDVLPEIRLYRWTVSSPRWPKPLLFSRVGPDLTLHLPEGRYRVEMSALIGVPWGTVVVRDLTAVTVSDLLVVAIGDSYASGEGNPETPRAGGRAAVWADGANAEAESRHATAHRSTVAWPARVALALEAADPRSSVTFVTVASSGDRIDRGIITSRGDDSSQIDQVRQIAGDRRIDLLLIQAGGNSAGFSHFIRALVEADPLLDPVCYDLMVSQAEDSVMDGDWRRDTRVEFRLPWEWSCAPRAGRGPRLPGIQGLDAAFGRLATVIAPLEVGNVVLTGYPDPTGADASGERCREIVGDTTPPLRFHEVSRDEGRLGVSALLEPLNARLRAIAADRGWRFADVAAPFAAGHGYCAPWPDYGYPPGFHDLPGFAASKLDYPQGWYSNPGLGRADYPGEVSWYRTAGQSAVLQGPAAPFATTGTLHPNEIGHQAIADLVVELVTSPSAPAK